LKDKANGVQITNLNCHPLRALSEIDGSQIARASCHGDNIPLTITFDEEKKCVLGLQDVPAVALMNKKASSAFRECLQYQGTYVNAYVSGSSLSRSMKMLKKSRGKAENFIVHANINGQSCSATEIGSLLSR
jgi:hypothetical protein